MLSAGADLSLAAWHVSNTNPGCPAHSPGQTAGWCRRADLDGGGLPVMPARLGG